jgi:hypothetical protein
MGEANGQTNHWGKQWTYWKERQQDCGKQVSYGTYSYCPFMIIWIVKHEIK